MSRKTRRFVYDPTKQKKMITTKYFISSWLRADLATPTLCYPYKVHFKVTDTYLRWLFASESDTARAAWTRTCSVETNIGTLRALTVSRAWDNPQLPKRAPDPLETSRHKFRKTARLPIKTQKFWTYRQHTASLFLHS